MDHQQTIVALSSAPPPAHRCIIRLSGEKAREIALGIFNPDGQPIARRWMAGSVRLDGLCVPGALILFESPASYTGQDAAEIHTPGSVWLVGALLKALQAAGARQAEPGEFTARAYFTGKMDLTAAEGISAAIAAQNEAELRAARSLLAGELATRVKAMCDRLAHLLALLEAGIDFTDEMSDQDISFITESDLRRRILDLHGELGALLRDSPRLERLSHEPRMLLLGRPNAGKSSLLNLLAGTSRAVVSDVAGTTRDILECPVVLPDGVVRLLDVAGVEDPAHDTTPDNSTAQISRMMALQAENARRSADFRIGVVDVTDTRPWIFSEHEIDLLIFTKSDKLKDVTAPAGTARGLSLPVVTVSVLGGQGFDDLRAVLGRVAFSRSSSSGLALTTRHVQALRVAEASLSSVIRQDLADPEVVALLLKETLGALASISGEVTPDDILGKVFANFCIGK